MRICLLTTQDLDADPFPEDDWPCDPRPFLPEADWHVAILEGKQESVQQVERLLNENFDLRSRIMPISGSNLELIRTAKDCGASAKFAGSGGSIIGTYTDENMYSRLQERLSKLQAQVFKPRIF